MRGKVFDYDSVENKDDFEVNGSVLIKAIRDSLRIDLDSQINETLGGWIIEQLNRMPAADDKVSFDKWDFIVVKVQSHRIERVRIVKNTGEEE